MGGALTIETVKSMLLQQNSFEKNSAQIVKTPSVVSLSLPSSKSQGGGVYSECREGYLNECAVKFSANTFDSNWA
jgi:hypothetical protein